MKYVNFCLIAIVSLIFSSAKTDSTPPSLGYYPGEILPNIELTDINGNSLKISELKGKKVLLNFWATYDAQSRATNVRLFNYLKENKPDVKMLSVSFDTNKGVFEKTIHWDNLEPSSQFCDTTGTQSKVFKKLKLKKGFKNYLINENGVISAINVTPENLAKLL